MPSTDDTVALLTKAADLAEKAAEVVGCGVRVVVGALTEDPAKSQRVRELVELRIKASGPDHWRAVATMFRERVELHQPELLGEATWCRHCGKRWTPAGQRLGTGVGCPTLAALRPLAELVVQHLREKP